MKTLWYSLLARNGVVVAAFIIVGIIIPSLPYQIRAPLSTLAVAGGAAGLVWANVILRRRSRWLFAAVMIAVLVPLSCIITVMASAAIKRTITEHQYRLSGMAMTNGCNLQKAMRAEWQLLENPESLSAKKNLAFWKRDVQLRGHQGRIPVVTNATRDIQDRDAATPQHDD